MKYIRILSLIVLSALSGSCSSLTPGANPPKCVDAGNRAVVISWGETVAKSDVTMGYRLRSDGSLSLIRKDADGKTNDEFIAKLKGDDYCNLKNQTEKTIIAQQAYSSPGATFRFIEYRDTVNGTLFRALWNPVSNNLGSKAFMVLYDTLVSYVPSIRSVK